MELRRSLHTSILVVLLLCINTATIAQVAGYCDRVFLSTGQDEAAGTASTTTANINNSNVNSFEAPSRIETKLYSLYPGGQQGKLILSKNSTPRNSTVAAATAAQLVGNNAVTNSTTRAMHCLYKFIAKEDERVSLSFTSFRLRGNEPECHHEYVDIYVRFKWPEDNLVEAMGRELPNGRFCTTIVPRKLVSQHNMIVLSIYSDLEPAAANKPPRPIFGGTYEFTRANKRIEHIGPPEEATLCRHTIYSSERREGEFSSLTYPGVYVKDLRCSYKFLGEPEQRIRLEFLDLDLYSGGPHCPFDSIKIFDGPSETDPIIQTICGSHRSLIIFSTRNELLVTFTTLAREAEIQDRGFSAYFEFSDKFLSPNFIQQAAGGANARHIRGTECDQRIVSTKGSSGLVVSPESTSSNHSNAICRYFFEGLQSSHDYEKVLLKFVEFDLLNGSSGGGGGGGTSQSQAEANSTSGMNVNISTGIGGNNNSASTSNTTTSDQCPDNYVRLYTGEQKPDQKQDPNDYDYVFCGRELPPTIESDAASLMMEYNSGASNVGGGAGGGRFKAEYTFIVDYRIPGSQASSTSCEYVYRSDIMKTGSFNSPRHPSWYINHMNCTFTFVTKPDEALLLQFTTFKMTKSFGENVVGYNEICRGEDSVSIQEIGSLEQLAAPANQYEIGTYCGTTTPGPLLSLKPVRVEFKTNKERVNYGFNAIYHFHSLAELRTNEFVSNCGETIHASHKLRSGSFSSPPTYRSETYEKRNHICTWNITARSGYRLALDFDRFELEGSPPVRGCATAAVRLEFNRSPRGTPIELCGTLPASSPNGTTGSHQYVSDDERLVVSFISTKQASGSNGFTATWTEIKRPAA